MTYRTFSLGTALATVLTLSACGGGDAPSTNTNPQPSQATSGQSTISANEPAPTATTDAPLSTSALSKATLLGEIADTVVETAPCPFLTDETAKATAKTDYTLIRREVSNETCRWSKNAGFSIRISIESVTTAKPFSERVYNLEVPPVLKPQAGPGANAVILYDTAWDKERAYAMGFEQDSKLIEIFVTGMATDETRLTRTAQEVAEKLPTAPAIEHQYREVKPAFEFCSIWSDASIANIMGASAEDGLYSQAYGKAGCKWSAGYGETAKALTFARYKKGDTNLEKMIELGGKEIEALGERSVILPRGPSDGFSGDAAMWVVLSDQQFSLTVSGAGIDHADTAQSLMNNFVGRLQ